MAAQVAHNKKVLLEALEKSLGVVTTACRSADIARRTHYNYMESDPEYAAAVRDLDNVAIDFAESKLHRQIDKGDTTACIFYLKTKGKDRGYVERKEHSGPDGGPIETKQQIVRIELTDD